MIYRVRPVTVAVGKLRLYVVDETAWGAVIVTWDSYYKSEEQAWVAVVKMAALTEYWVDIRGRRSV